MTIQDIASGKEVYTIGATLSAEPTQIPAGNLVLDGVKKAGFSLLDQLPLPDINYKYIVAVVMLLIGFGLVWFFRNFIIEQNING